MFVVRSLLIVVAMAALAQEGIAPAQGIRPDAPRRCENCRPVEATPRAEEAPIVERNGVFVDAPNPMPRGVTTNREQDALTRLLDRRHVDAGLRRAYPTGTANPPSEAEVDRNQYNAICQGPASTQAMAEWCVNQRKKVFGR